MSLKKCTRNVFFVGRIRDNNFLPIIQINSSLSCINIFNIINKISKMNSDFLKIILQFIALSRNIGIICNTWLSSWKDVLKYWSIKRGDIFQNFVIYMARLNFQHTFAVVIPIYRKSLTALKCHFRYHVSQHKQ